MKVGFPTMAKAPKHRSRDATQVDAHIGQKIRARRNLLGLSQTELANAAGVTFQQIQKYEKGVNRVGASRLLQFSEALGVPPSYFLTAHQPSERRLLRHRRASCRKAQLFHSWGPVRAPLLCVPFSRSKKNQSARVPSGMRLEFGGAISSNMRLSFQAARSIG